MADHIITGKVHLINTTDPVRVAEQMEKASHDCGIHIRFKNFTSGEKILSFTVTDSPDSKECDRIISGISFRAIDFSMADVSETGLPDVERFLTAVIDYREIDMIEISFDHTHGSNLRKYEIVTEAKHFCFAVMHTPNHGHTLPTAIFRIYHAAEFGAPETVPTEDITEYNSTLAADDIEALQLLVGGDPFCLRAASFELSPVKDMGAVFFRRGRMFIGFGDEHSVILAVSCDYDETPGYLDIKKMSFSAESVEHIGGVRTAYDEDDPERESTAFIYGDEIVKLQVYRKEVTLGSERAIYDTMIVLYMANGQAIVMGVEENISDDVYMTALDPEKLNEYIKIESESRYVGAECSVYEASL